MSEKDGIYIEVLVVKDGIRYNTKIVNMKDVSAILTNSLMDGIETVIGVDTHNDRER
jgi:hypothetical protein